LDTNTSGYDKLAKAYGCSGSDRLLRILRMLMTDEEAFWLSRLPATPGQLAEDLVHTAAEARAALEPLADQGLAIRGEETPTGSRYSRLDLGWLADWTLANPQYERLGSAFYDAWRDFYNEESVPRSQEQRKQEVEHKPTKFRVLPAESALPAEGVLDHERASWIVRQARKIAIAQCPCRRRERRCETEHRTCMFIDDLADYGIAHGAAEAIELDEALAILEWASREGLVHDTENIAHPRVICNCCPCCCAFLRPVVAYGFDLPVETSRYQVRLDASRCTGCGACLERCSFGALQGRDGHPLLQSDKCIGCGLCAVACPEGALGLEITREIAFSETGAQLGSF
jgi:ferredoxin